jgi:exodeoxyribonuclease X
VSTTRLLVVDTETTGTGPEDQVIEISVRGRELHEDGTLFKRWKWHSLVRPSCPIAPEARATHHVTDEELEKAPTMEELLDQQPELGGLRENRSLEEDNRVLVAHVVGFDRKMLAQSARRELLLPVREICTHRCALHVWPDAPRHSNQVLRYWLGIDVPKSSGPPHRAQHDTLVTDGILDHLLAVHGVSELVRVTKEPMMLKWCRIGDQAGKLWADVNEGFLRWLLAKGESRPNPRGGRNVGFSADERMTARYWLSIREAERAENYAAARAKRLGLPSPVQEKITADTSGGGS